MKVAGRVVHIMEVGGRFGWVSGHPTGRGLRSRSGGAVEVGLGGVVMPVPLVLRSTLRDTHRSEEDAGEYVQRPFAR